MNIKSIFLKGKLVQKHAENENNENSMTTLVHSELGHIREDVYIFISNFP